MSPMESEFERFRKATAQSGDTPLNPGPAPLLPSEAPAETVAPSSARLSSIATPTPGDLLARQSFVMENLGIRQASTVLEYVYPEEYPCIESLVAGYKPDKANLLLCSPKRPPLNVLDLLTHAFGTQEMALEVIIPYLQNTAARNRTALRPDYLREFPVEALPDVARKVVHKLVEIHGVDSQLVQCNVES